MTELFDLSQIRQRRRLQPRLYFTRGELSQMLALYSSQVARGQWRDYAIDHTPGVAAFSVFRCSHEQPLFCIIKLSGGNSPPEYALLQDRRRLAKAASLSAILAEVRRSILMTAVSN